MFYSLEETIHRDDICQGHRLLTVIFEHQEFWDLGFHANKSYILINIAVLCCRFLDSYTISTTINTNWQPLYWAFDILWIIYHYFIYFEALRDFEISLLVDIIAHRFNIVMLLIYIIYYLFILTFLFITFELQVWIYFWNYWITSIPLQCHVQVYNTFLPASAV